MAKSPREQRRTDRKRIAPRGTGRLDRDARPDRNVSSPRADECGADRHGGPQPDRAAQRSFGATGQSPLDELRARLVKSRDEAMEQLPRLRRSPEADDNAPRAGNDTVLDEGDEAQASERQDLCVRRASAPGGAHQPAHPGARTDGSRDLRSVCGVRRPDRAGTAGDDTRGRDVPALPGAARTDGARARRMTRSRGLHRFRAVAQ
jgi:hypothetical protein